MDEWEKYELHHRKRLAIKPGLTGMWQVSGRSDITDFEEVVELDTNVISIASIQLIITSISSTQTAIFRRNFEFRKLFIARISVAIAPLVITVPLAIILRTYWAYKRKSQKTHHFSRNFRTSSSGNPENLEISSGEKLGSCSMRCAVNKACS